MSTDNNDTTADARHHDPRGFNDDEENLARARAHHGGDPAPEPEQQPSASTQALLAALDAEDDSATTHPIEEQRDAPKHE